MFPSINVKNAERTFPPARPHPERSEGSAPLQLRVSREECLQFRRCRPSLVAPGRTGRGADSSASLETLEGPNTVPVSPRDVVSQELASSRCIPITAPPSQHSSFPPC